MNATNPTIRTDFDSPSILHILGINKLLNKDPMFIATKLTICVANGPNYNLSLKNNACYLTHKDSS